MLSALSVAIFLRLRLLFLCDAGERSQRFFGGGILGSGRLLAAPPGNRSCAFRCSVPCLRSLCALCAEIYKVFVCMCLDDNVTVLSVFVSQCALLFALIYKSRLRAGPFSFWGISSFQTLVLILKRFRSVPLMGGPQGPSVSRSPETAPQKMAGRPMGPSTPLCQPQSFLALVLVLMLKPKGLCFVILWRCLALGKRVWFSEPFKLLGLVLLIVRVFLGTPSGWGVHRHNDFLVDDMSRTTGDGGVVLFLCYGVCFCRLD